MLRRIKIILGILFLYVALSLGMSVVEAKEATGEAAFSIAPIIPGTQLDMSKSFFYVQTKPGEEQNLQIQVSSSTDTPIEIQVQILDSISTEEGRLGFGEPIIKDESLKNPISEIVTTDDETFTLNPGEDKMLNLKVKPPASSYDGVKYGAVVIQSKTGEEGIVDVYNGFRTGIILSEDGKPFNDGETLDITEVTPTLSRGRKVIQAGVSNPEPKTIEHLEIEAKLVNKKDGKVIKEEKVIDYMFAPNSTMPFTFDWGLSNLVAGTYILKMDISNEMHEWQLEKEFVLTENQVKKVNDESPFRIVTPKWMKFLSIGLGLLVIIIIIFLIIRNHKWKTEVKKNKRNNRRNKSRNKKKRG